MMPTRSRPLSVVLMVLALLSVPGAAYAVERPHTREGLVAHTRTVPEATPLPTSALATGDVPTIPYAFAPNPGFGQGDWRLVRPDGPSLELPRLTWSAWAPMGDGAIGMAGTEAGPELQRVSGTGTVTSRMVNHFGLQVSPDHEIVGWLDNHGRTRVVEGGGARRFAMPKVAHASSLSAIWGERTCQEEAPEGGGCTVFVQRRRHVWVSTSHGTVDRAGPMLRVADVNQDGRVIGLAKRSS